MGVPSMSSASPANADAGSKWPLNEKYVSLSNTASGDFSTACIVLIAAGPWISIFPSLSVRSTQRTSRPFLFASRCLAMIPPIPALTTTTYSSSFTL